MPGRRGKLEESAGPIRDSNPLAAIAGDDLEAGLQDLHRGGPDLHVAGRAGAVGDTDDREAALLLDEPAEFRELARPDLRLDLRDLGLGDLQLLVDRPLRRPPVLELLLVLFGLAGKLLFAPLQVRARRFELLFEREHLVLGRADLLVDAVDLVQDRAVLAARLNVAQLRLVLLLFLLVVGELRRSPGDARSRLRSIGPGCDARPPVFRGARGRPRSDRREPCRAPARGCGRTGAAPGGGRADRDPSRGAPPATDKKGCPG